MRKESYLQIRREHSFGVQSRYLFFQLLVDFALIYSSWWLCEQGSGWQFLAIPLLSTLYFRNFSFMHEASHHLISKNKSVNDYVGIWAGGLSGLPFEPWKKSHLQHHFWSGNYQKDPVMALIEIIPKWSPRTLAVVTTLWKLWVPILAFLQYAVFWVLSLGNFSKEKTFKSFLSLFVPIALVVGLVAFASFQTLATVILPSVYLYLVAVDVVNLPHHLQLPMMNGESRLAVWEQHSTTRTCLYPKWAARLIILNFNYHTEHHLFPDAPWYYLDQLYEAVHKELGAKQNIDPSFQWIIENRVKTIVEVVNPNVEANRGEKRVS